MDLIRRCLNPNLTTETDESRSNYDQMSVDSPSTTGMSSNEQGSNCAVDVDMGPDQAQGTLNSRQGKEMELIKTLKEKDFNFEKVKDLITSGQAGINACDKSQNTVLHLAILKVDNNNNDHFEFIKFLIENKADMKARNKGDETPFLLAVRKNKYSLINLFAGNTQNDINAVNRDGDNVLHVAVKNNHEQCVWMLHKHSKKYDLRENKTNNVNLTPVGIAKASDYKVIRKILVILETDPDDLKLRSEEEPQLPHNLSLQTFDSEYKRQKQTETNDKGGIYTQTRIEMHQSESGAELVLVHFDPHLAAENVTYTRKPGGNIHVFVSGEATAFVGDNKIITEMHDSDLKTHFQLGNSANSAEAIQSPQEPDLSQSPMNGAQAVESGRETLIQPQSETPTNCSLPIEHSWHSESTQVTVENPVNNPQAVESNTEEPHLKTQLLVENSSNSAEAVDASSRETADDSYVMTANTRGICLVIKNEYFDKDTKLNNRIGCQEDVDKLKETFEGLLSFKFEVEENLSMEKMLSKLREYANKDHSQYNCFVACILSHGCAGAIYGVDGKTLDVKTILQLFSSSNAETLADKPKLFFFNCCREREAVSDGPNSAVADKKLPTAPDRSDIFVGYSCPDGYLSWRYEDANSWYIPELCQALKEQAQSKEFQHIMLLVNDRMSQYNVDNKTQISSSANQLRKLLYFFPKKR